MTDFETLKSTLKEEILKELSFKTEGHELKTRKTKKNEKNVEGATEEKPVKPKRKCTEKQLAALAAGRQKNPRWIAKRMKEEERAKALEGQSPEEKKKQEEEKKSE